MNNRTLVVDDSSTVRRFVCEVLHELGFPSIDEAADGAAAFALFRRVPYDLVITDWYMPLVDGLQLLRAIRRSKERPKTPVLVVTGHVTPARVVEALEAGANGFALKPLDADALSEKVLRLVGCVPSAFDFMTPGG